MTLEERLSALYTDFIMLKTGQWQPDDSSINSSIDNLEQIADELDIELIDLRDNEG